MTKEELAKMDKWELGRLVIDKASELKQLQTDGGTAVQFENCSKDIKIALELLQEKGWIEP